MANCKWQIANCKWQMANCKWQMKSYKQKRSKKGKKGANNDLSLRGSEATKQSRTTSFDNALDCFALLAMTSNEVYFGVL